MLQMLKFHPNRFICYELQLISTVNASLLNVSVGQRAAVLHVWTVEHAVQLLTVVTLAPAIHNSLESTAKQVTTTRETVTTMDAYNHVTVNLWIVDFDAVTYAVTYALSSLHQSDKSLGGICMTTFACSSFCKHRRSRLRDSLPPGNSCELDPHPAFHVDEFVNDALDRCQLYVTNLCSN